jgi:hypothetical protein
LSGTEVAAHAGPATAEPGMLDRNRSAGLLALAMMALVGSVTVSPASATIYHSGMGAQARTTPFGLEVDVYVTLVTPRWTEPFLPTAEVFDAAANRFVNWTTEQRYSLNDYFNGSVPCCVTASLFIWQGTFSMTSLPFHAELHAGDEGSVDLFLPGGVPLAAACSPFVSGGMILAPKGKGCETLNPTGYDVRDLVTGLTIGTVLPEMPFVLPIHRSGIQFLELHDGAQAMTLMFDIPAPAGVGLLGFAALGVIRLMARRPARSVRVQAGV